MLALEEHRIYLADRPRLDAYRAALARAVKPGDVVVDLGSGTGILGLLALQAGAGRVYSIDSGPMIEVAREVCRANGFQHRVVFVRGLSTRVDLPEPADVILADQVGWFGFDAGILGYFNDARRRFLKPGGTLVPSAVELHVAPVEAPNMWDDIEFWERRPAGLDFGPVRPLAANTAYPTKHRPEQLLAPPERLGTFDLNGETPASLEGGIAFECRRDGTLHGVAGWFRARLAEEAYMTNSPESADAVDRRQLFFPLDRPIPVRAGARVSARFRILPREHVMNWTVESGSQRRVHSTLKGLLLSREDLARTRPDSRPALTHSAQARVLAMSLCDGTRPLAEIEKEVHRRHPELFRTAAEAAALVAEVVARHAR